MFEGLVQFTLRSSSEQQHFEQQHFELTDARCASVA